MFIFICGFSEKLFEAFLVYKKKWRTHRNKHFSSQIKESRVPLQIGHCHLCMEGHFKLRVQSL